MDGAGDRCRKAVARPSLQACKLVPGQCCISMASAASAHTLAGAEKATEGRGCRARWRIMRGPVSHMAHQTGMQTGALLS